MESNNISNKKNKIQSKNTIQDTMLQKSPTLGPRIWSSLLCVQDPNKDGASYPLSMYDCHYIGNIGDNHKNSSLEYTAKNKDLYAFFHITHKHTVQRIGLLMY
jgi:hypothetical protein